MKRGFNVDSALFNLKTTRGFNIGFKKLYYALFGNKTRTLADGTRQLVNEGTSATNGTLYSGHGLYFNGVDQYVDTGFVPVIGQPFTVLWSQEIPVGNTLLRLNGSRPTINDRFYFGVEGNTTQMSVGYGFNVTKIFHNILPGEVGAFAWTWDGVSTTGKVFESAAEIGTSDMSVPPSNVLPLLLGAFNDVGVTKLYVSGMQMAFLFIPQALTSQEIQAHYANPEKTLYWEDGTLKSAFLPQATIDAMQAGNGFWYPLNENESAGGYARNHALPLADNLIVNGGFDTDLTGWVATTGGWTWENGKAKLTGDGSPQPLQQFDTLTIGTTYVIEFDVEATGGPIGLENASYAVFVHGYSGTIRTVWTADRTSLSFKRNSGTVTGTIDNVKVYPLSTSGLSTITNYTSTMRTNAQTKPYGYQSALVTKDTFGLQTGLVASGELDWDGRSYADLGGLTVSGDFEIDIVIYKSGSVPSTTIGSSNFTRYSTGNEFLRLDYNAGVRLALFNPDRSILSYEVFINPSVEQQVIISVIKNGSTLILLKNGIVKYTGTANVGITDSSIIFSRFAPNTVIEDTGTFQITQGTRTDEQRTKDIAKLAAKHGVTL